MYFRIFIGSLLAQEEDYSHNCLRYAVEERRYIAVPETLIITPHNGAPQPKCVQIVLGWLYVAVFLSSLDKFEAVLWSKEMSLNTVVGFKLHDRVSKVVKMKTDHFFRKSIYRKHSF